MVKNKKTFKTYLFVLYFSIIACVFSSTAAYAWFSSSLTNIDGDLNLGNLSATANLYENYDDSLGIDTYIDGLTDATTMDSTGTSITAYNLIQKSWYSNAYTSIYIEVENTGTIDLKSLLKLSYDNSDLITFLSYYYYQLVEITQDVNAYNLATDRENLSAYNTSFQSNISANVETYIDNVKTNGYCITSDLSVVNMGTVKYAGTSYYRLDIALSEIPSELLTEYNALPVEDREIKINGIITIKQTNAPDDEDNDSGLFVYVSTADAFILAVNSASNGDTIYLTTNISISRNITITHRINIILNGYTLIINGNLGYDVGVAGVITLDVSNSSYLYVLGNLIIDTPNCTFRVLGSGSSAQAIVLGNGTDEGTGGFYVNCLKDDNNTETYGYYQYGVSVMKKLTTVVNTLATMNVDSNTRVSIGVGSTCGPIVSVVDASDIEVYNYGEIQSIDFSNMFHSNNTNIQIYIYNRNKFSSTDVVITLPSWSLGWKSKELQNISNAINTRIINAPGSITDYDITGSLVFLDIDIENGDVATDSVINLSNNYYRVNMQLDGNGFDTITLRYYLQAYYNNSHNNATEVEFETWLTTIDGLVLYTYSTAVVKILDFTFMNAYLTGLQSLDLLYSNIEDGKIPDSAFYNKVSLENIYFPLNDLEIGTSAFYGTSLESVSLSGYISAIGANAFDVNTGVNGLLKVFYEGENTSSLLSYISGLTVDKTLLFMSQSNIEAFKAYYSVTSAWHINSYTKYDFVDEYQNYYRIVDGSNVEIVYYAGSWSNINIFNTIIIDTKSYRVVGISNSAYRRSINAAGTTAVSILLPSNMLTIRGDAFYGAYINILDLNNVQSIASYAFANTHIAISDARPTTFLAMTAVGERAFANTIIGVSGTTSLITFENNNVTNGVINNNLDLRGSYTPGVSVFDSAALYGTVLNLSGVSVINSNMTNNLSLYGCELYLNNVTEISDSAFESRFKSYIALYPYNKVFAEEVKTIGRYAFRGMYLDEFIVGVKSLYITQGQVNSNCSYGGIIDGMIYSDFKATTLTIDGMLPQIASGRSTFLFGSATAGRTYDNVYIKNTSGLLYDFMFYALAENAISITNLYLYDISTIGSYAFYCADVTNVYSYSGQTLLTNSAATTVGEYAFRYSDCGTFGNLNLTSVDTYAFADTIVPASSLTINGVVSDYAFYNSNTTNVQTISLTGTVGVNVFNLSNISTVSTIYIKGTVGQNLFTGASIHHCTSITFEDTSITSNTFNGAIIYSACDIITLGVSSAATLSFYNLTATLSTLDLTNCLSIANEALKKINVLTVNLGNTNFYTNNTSSFVYGTATGGIFTGTNASTVTNLYIDGELPSQKLGTYILGASGADLNITNIYITSDCTIIPANTFYSASITGCLKASNLYIQSEDLLIGELAFGCSSINNIIYDAVNYGTISFNGENAFYFASIGNFTNFTYYDSYALENDGVLDVISDYTFHYTTFKQNSDLSLLSYVSSIGNHAFDHATFVQTSGGANVSFDFTKVPTIGYAIFESIYSTIGTLTLGNNDYYQTSLLGFYYGNPLGSEGILTTSGSITIEDVVIAGNLPNSNVTDMYQTRALGISNNSNVTIDTITVQAAVTKIAAYAFSGFSAAYRTSIEALEIYSASLDIGQSAFAYTNIASLTMYSSDINLNKKSFEYSILTSVTYDRTSGAGEITFASTAEYTFEYTTIYAMTGFTSGTTGVVEEICDYAFYNATFGVDCNISWINYVDTIGDNAFMYCTFTRTSLNAYVQIDLTRVISIGEEIFAFIPVKIGTLTLGNSSYASLYGDSYSYGNGINGIMYAAGLIDILNITGNLPTVNTNNMLGNSYTESTWAVRYGTINVSAGVTSIPAGTFISSSASVPVIIGTVNINSTTMSVGVSAFYYATISDLNFTDTTLSVGANAFNSTNITRIDITATSIAFGTAAFKNATIPTISYNGTTSGVITMSGPNTFEGCTITTITGFTYTVSTVTYTIVSNISDYAFKNAIFASNCNIAWIQYVNSIGSYAFSGTTFTKTSSDTFVNLNLTRVLTIGDNAFYHLPISLGTVTVGNNSYTSNPAYAYGNGVEGIFNNAGTIQHLIISGNLPTTAYAFGNRTSDITYLTTFIAVDIQTGITSLPKGLFAGFDTVYATNITTLYIYTTSVVVGEEFLNNTIITNFNMPNTTTFNGVGANAFKGSSITNINVSHTLTITGSVNASAFYGFDFTDVTLNVASVSYLGDHAFSYITYVGSLLFSTSLTMIDADYVFANADISGNITFNSIRSLGSNGFSGLISGITVTYTFTFVNCLSVTSDYAFANMNGGGSVYVLINGLPTLDSYRCFYNSTNITSIVFDTELLSMNADNIFEGASNLVSISLNNINDVALVNATIVTIPDQVKIYVPGNLLADYLMDPYWSLVMDQISTTYNIDDSRTWGFYILGETYNASLCKYLGAATSVTIPETIIYNLDTYTILALGPDIFTGTSATDITIPNAVQRVDMDLFSNGNIANVTLTGAGTAPFYIATESGKKVIYESSAKEVLYKYLSSNTATSYTIVSSVSEVCERAFYKNNYIQTITYSSSSSSEWDILLAENAITECPALTSISLAVGSLSYGVILSPYAISSNPELTSLSFTGFKSVLNSYSIYNNVSLTTVLMLHNSHSYVGNYSRRSYSNVLVQPYAFFGSGLESGTTCFYTDIFQTYIYSHAFGNSRITLFEFDVNITYSQYNVDVYNADAFAVGEEIEVNENGDVIQTFASIIIRVRINYVTAYKALRGFSYYSTSIVGVSSFSHHL